MSPPFMNLRRIQVCKACDSFCKLAFVAKWPRRHDSPWHFARTDIGCPRSRAKKSPLSRAGKCRVERAVSYLADVDQQTQVLELSIELFRIVAVKRARDDLLQQLGE